MNNKKVYQVSIFQQYCLDHFAQISLFTLFKVMNADGGGRYCCVHEFNERLN